MGGIRTSVSYVGGLRAFSGQITVSSGHRRHGWTVTTALSIALRNGKHLETSRVEVLARKLHLTRWGANKP
jgi:hypothetical protein